MTLQRLFSIGEEGKAGNTLLLEFGPDHCCYAFLDSGLKSFDLVRYFSFDETESGQHLNSILEEMGLRNFEKVIVCSAFPQALLVPQKHFTSDRLLLDSVYDVPGQNYLNYKIAEWQMVTTYAFPSAIFEAVTTRFPAAVFFHAYVPTLKIYNGFVAPDQLDIHFSTQHFRVLVKKDNAVQLAQTYAYKTPLDVAYYLLKICYEFKLDQKEAFVILSGLIDQDSALYSELHNYFLNLHFAQAPSYSLPANGYPHYYFTSLYNLAACVS